jgi:hypothetical protein
LGAIHIQKRVVVLSAVLSFVILGACVSSAFAITGNFQPSASRSCVGVVVFYSTDAFGNMIPLAYCSGVLISPTVLLTAAHACVTQSVLVCFDVGPLTLLLDNGQLQFQGVTSVFTGTAYPNPAFTMNVDGKSGLPYTLSNDVAVVILDQPVPSTVVDQFGALPEIGVVDTLPVNTAVELVGYGVQQQTAPKKAGIENSWIGLVMRNSAQAKTLSTNFAWSDEFLRCSANPGHGRGGIAFGDSGGPVFLGQTNQILALNSYVTNPNCVGVSYHTRLDTTAVQTWINQEVSIHG